MHLQPTVNRTITFEEAIAGTEAPSSVIEQLCLVTVPYIGFDSICREGQLVVHKDVHRDIVEIFDLMAAWEFPVSRIVPIVRYGWSDDASMADNNTSAFNYRYVAGTTRLSAHALGLAVDINPFVNPVIYADGRVSPPGTHYDSWEKGVLTAEGPVVRELLRRGWRWGGLFVTFKDYHHFEFAT
jgi:hypothetical protein